MIRVLCLAGGLAGAAGLSQFPEFSQQYLQRLAGQVDALTIVVKEFDAAALAEGMGREEALEDLASSDFQLSHQASMRATFARHARLAENLMILREASSLQLLTLPHRMTDGPLVQDVWADFNPAVPASVAGAAAAGAGFLGGRFGLLALLTMIIVPLRKMARKVERPDDRKEPAMRVDPPLARPRLVAEAPDHRPRLAGVQR